MKIIYHILDDVQSNFTGDVVLNREYKLFFDQRLFKSESTTTCPYCNKGELRVYHKFCYHCGVKLYFERITIENE